MTSASPSWSDVPVEIGRDDARELARRELTDPIYDRDRSLVTRVVDWLLDQVDRLLVAAGGALSSTLGIVLVVVIVTSVVIVIILRAGPLAPRGKRRPDAVFADGRRGAAQHLVAANAAATAGDWATAVVERYRAIVASLEERGILDRRPGRTADEAADEAGATLVTMAEPLASAAALFDAVRYGGRTAESSDDDVLRHLHDDLRSARASTTSSATPTLAVLR